MKNESLVMWNTVPVKHKIKMWHIHKIGKKLHKDFCLDYGDIPMGSFNTITQKFEACDNTRGLSYAARKRLKYRKTKHEKMK